MTDQQTENGLLREAGEETRALLIIELERFRPLANLAAGWAKEPAIGYGESEREAFLCGALYAFAARLIGDDYAKLDRDNLACIYALLQEIMRFSNANGGGDATCELLVPSAFAAGGAQ